MPLVISTPKIKDDYQWGCAWYFVGAKGAETKAKRG
jgi:hypothetical protein